MTREEKIFEMAKSIAPRFVDPQFKKELLEKEFTDSPTIPQREAMKIKVWATAIVDELENND